MNDFQIHHRENGDFEVEHLAPSEASGAPHGVRSDVSGIEGAGKRDGAPGAVSEGASDLRQDIEEDGFVTVHPRVRP